MEVAEFKSEKKCPRWPLWSVLWRTLFIAPILWLFGGLFFILVVASIFGPPVYAYLLFADGRYVFGPLLLIAWVFWVRYGCRLLGWLLQGFEYSAM
jgi:hypothetical protein